MPKDQRPSVWVITRGDGKWEVRHVGGRGIIGAWERREDALVAARQIARLNGAQTFAQGLDGQITDLDWKDIEA